MSEFLELEFKYKADDVKLSDFLKLMETLKVTKRLDVSSWDHYFVKSEDEFLRFRNGQNPELTIKRKTKDTNNWNRVECDLPLDQSRITKDIVTKFAELEGYKENFSIYKTCFIFWLDNVNYVYYIVYDSNMKEQGRFIEVEINKSSLGNLTDPTEELKKQEKLLEPLGISPQNRMKKSLYEMFKK